MCCYGKLDIENVARIGLMYLDGDKLEEILLDRYGDTDYDFDNFNEVKKSIMKLERINPDLKLSAFLWRLHPNNSNMAIPVVAGNALPMEGWGRTLANEVIKAVFETGEKKVMKRTETLTSYYYPVRNSDDEIVGVLELLHGDRERNDI